MADNEDHIQKHRDDNYRYTLKSAKRTYNLVQDIAQEHDLTFDQALQLLICQRLQWLNNIG
jgi:hypothetical protein